MNKDLQQIETLIAPLLQQPAWGVRLGVGSFVTVEFGAPVVREGRPHGEWHLWVYCCAWRLETPTAVLAGSEDERPKLEEAVKNLEGRTLLSVELMAPSLQATLLFDTGLRLHLLPVTSEEYEHWLLYLPDGNVLVIGPGSSWACEPASGRAPADA